MGRKPHSPDAQMINTDITAADVNSYASEDELASFAALRGIELPETLAPLLIKAMDYLEGLDWVTRALRLLHTSSQYSRKHYQRGDLQSGMLRENLF